MIRGNQSSEFMISLFYWNNFRSLFGSEFKIVMVFVEKIVAIGENLENCFDSDFNSESPLPKRDFLYFWNKFPFLT